LHNPPANGKQGPIPEEMSQTPLTNKKLEETWTKYTPLTLLSQRKLALTVRNTYCSVKDDAHLTLKTGLDSIGCVDPDLVRQKLQLKYEKKI
jgi:hypothetical protein